MCVSGCVCLCFQNGSDLESSVFMCVCGFVGRLVRVLAIVGVGVCVSVCVCVCVWHASCFKLESVSFIFLHFHFSSSVFSAIFS